MYVYLYYMYLDVVTEGTTVRVYSVNRIQYIEEQNYQSHMH